jgi:outer membrane receptor protein involved in Fe transport
MPRSAQLFWAIASILGVSSGALAVDSPGNDSSGSGTPGIEEIVVTAQRRAENMQDVPITIQALTGDTLKQLNVTTFDDFIRYLPNVTQASYGPGQSSIYMRGLSIGTVGGIQASGTLGQIPNVAVYLDDQSASLPGRNLDVYAADIERIEVLEGPQGTLFGSGAQAGVLRYITNKPKLDATETLVNAGYSTTAHGDPNSNVDATINIPLIQDTLALRAVVYSDSRGGYINNLPATFKRAGTDLDLVKYNNGVVPASDTSINNASLVGNAINPLTYKGIRASLLYRANDAWEALLTQSYQDMHANGVFYEMPYASQGTTFTASGKPIGSEPLPPLSVNLFSPTTDRDRFENTALQISGKIGDLKAVYSGSYLVRNVAQTGDYTNYARGVYASYYQCTGLTGQASGGTCYSPQSGWRDTERNTHQSHELRVSTPDDGRVRGIVGLYYEQFVIIDDTEWLYKTVPTCSPSFTSNCFNNVAPVPGAFSSTPGERGDSTAFIDNFKRTIDQKALFGSLDVDIIPKTLTLTLGTRYYRFNEQEVGYTVSSFGCLVSAPTTYFGACQNPSTSNLNTQNPNSSVYSGFKSRANLSYKVTDDALLYYTWSQGFRPGGFNRASTGHLPINGIAQYFVPTTYAPDSLVNNELGFKTLWLDHRLELNGAVYEEDWKNTQVQFFDPQSGLGNLTFATNGPNYRVRGLELQLIARATEGLSIQGSMSYNDSRQTNSPSLVNNNPLSPTFGQPIASIANPYGAEGSRLASAPLVQANLRIRHETTLGDYKAFWQAGGQHTGDSISATGNIISYDQPGYTTYDASVGVARDRWNAELFGQNLTSVNASTGSSAGQFVETETVTRPRVLGIKFGYRF